MRISKLTRIIVITTLVVLTGLVIIISTTALSAGNTVAGSHLGTSLQSITANAIKPKGCESLNLTNIIICSGSGICKGTGASNLILGTAGNDTIQGKNGTDCIIAGGGDDDVQANKGGDICIEGPGNDTYKDCTVVYP